MTGEEVGTLLIMVLTFVALMASLYVEDSKR